MKAPVVMSNIALDFVTIFDIVTMIFVLRVGKRRYKFTYRKNKERIKCGKCLRVSIPLDRITVCTCDTPSLVVSYDLKRVPVSSVDSLKQRMSCTHFITTRFVQIYVHSAGL